MTAGRIVTLPRERLEDRSAVAVCGWVRERERLPAAPASRWLVPSRNMDVSALCAGLPDSSSRAPLLFLLSREPPPALLSFLLESARPDRQTYVLAPIGFGEGSRDPGLRDLARARVLVRRTVDVPASGVLLGRGEAGLLWLGASGAAPTWVLRLGSPQGVAMFTAFLHLFWHHATDEAFGTGKNLDFRSAKKRPFDVTLPAEAPVKLRQAPAHLVWAQASAACGPADSPATSVLKTLLTRPGAEHHSVLAERAAAGCAIVSNDLDLPLFALGSTERRVAVGSGNWSLHVDLNDAQATDLLGVTGAMLAAPSWRFHASTALGTLSNKRVWLASEKEPAVPAAEQVLDAGRAGAVELRLVPATEPRSLPVSHPLALSVRMRWSVDPPRVPPGAAEDKLVVAWSGLDGAVRDRIDAVSLKLDKVEQHAKGVAAKLVSLASALLGFDRGRTERRGELEELARRTPSQLGPAGARKLLERLRALEDGVTRLDRDQREAERKEEERLDLEEQRRKWDAEQAEKSDELAQAEADLRGAKELQQRLKSEFQEAEEAYRKEKDDANKKDLYTRMGKVKDEQKTSNHEVLSREGRVRKLEDDIQRPFKPKSLERRESLDPRNAQAAGARFVPPPAADDRGVTPTEALPSVGMLRAVKAQRYLVIEQWEHLEAGEEEARRLSAKLVAPAEGT